MSTTKKLLEVGTKVRMSKAGKLAYNHARNNPHDLEGIVFKNDNIGEWIYAVEWENNSTNHYKIDELEPVEKTVEGKIADKIADRFISDFTEKVRESVEDSFEILQLGVDKVYSGDWFIFHPIEGASLDIYESDETQLEPDCDDEYSAVGGYIAAERVLAAFRLSGRYTNPEDLTQEELQAIVDASPQKLAVKPVEFSKEDVEVLRTFAPNAKSGENFINKIRKTKTADLTEVLKVLDKLFE